MNAFGSTERTTTAPAPTTIEIELLALDLQTCTRCRGSSASIEAAIALVEPVLQAAGIGVRLQERVIATREEAERHRFLVSPTIRVAGRDIAPNIHESHCNSCTDLCGCAEGTDCREWHYRGETHDEAPVGLIVEAIMRAAFGQVDGEQSDTGTAAYPGVPENLTRFFAGRAEQAAMATCCNTAAQASCCEPSEKASCCGVGEPATCGCQ